MFDRSDLGWWSGFLFFWGTIVEDNPARQWALMVLALSLALLTIGDAFVHAFAVVKEDYKRNRN